MTDKIYDRVYIGYVVADTYEEAKAKKMEWVKDKNTLTYILDKSYRNRAYKDGVTSRDKVKSSHFRICSFSYSFPLTGADIIVA